MNKILGLDLGIASLGYCVINIDDENFAAGDILATGVRIFDVAENPKDGNSLAAPGEKPVLYGVFCVVK